VEKVPEFAPILASLSKTATVAFFEGKKNRKS
jgi:hypothetical protein